MAGRLEGKVCVITGTASGIGAESARLFQSEGAQVVGVDLSPDAVGDLAIQADVTDPEQVEGMYAQAREQFGKIDVLFNNAGISPDDDASILDTSVEAWDRVQNVNLKSVFLCCKFGIPHLLDNGGGSIINVASFVAVMGAAVSQVSYTASKGGVLAMSRELGVEFAKQGIRVNALCPGPVNTPLLRSCSRRTPRRPSAGSCTCRRGASPSRGELAAGALFLASDESSFVNATTFLVDGGLTAAYLTPL